MKIRVIKTGSGARAVQVIRYQNNKRIVLKHIGSAHTDQEVDELKILAEEWIKSFTGQLSFIEEENPNQFFHLSHCSFLGVRYHFFYQTINTLYGQVGFHTLPLLLQDLTTIRIFEPASKVRSIELLDLYFGVKHSRKNYYKIAPDWTPLKSLVEEKVIDFARVHYSFNFDLLFYDVTTLYFETFTEDELRENGFSKDNKLGQPQILIALMVSKEGFPISYEIFSGSTFEGHTLIPVITDFIHKHQVKEFTVVADAAMISDDNIEQLLDNKINYIVGARLGNISRSQLDLIDQNLPREDGKTLRIPTNKGYLICSFSSIRYRKDKYEMEKQIAKAEEAVKHKSKNKRFKFVSSKGEKRELNQKLIEKTNKLLGIKGYYANLEENIASNQMIIDRYHELYKIEQAFRMSKHDLQARPIFHYKKEPIKLHILICFMALVISKHIELQSGVSIRSFINEAKKIADGLIINKITNKTSPIKAEPTTKMIKILSKIF